MNPAILPGVLASARTASAVYLLDLYPSVKPAWGLRKYKSAYAGSCCRIRRTSDNAEFEIGFNGAGRVDDAAISAHCAGTNGRVVKLYDQNGGVIILTQATATLQPKIYDSGGGLILNEHGQVAMQSTEATKERLYTYDTTVSGLGIFGPPYTAPEYLSILVGVQKAAMDSQGALVWNNTTGTGYTFAYEDGSTVTTTSDAAASTPYFDGVAISPNNRNGLHDLLDASVDTVILGAKTWAPNGWSAMAVCGYTGGAFATEVLFSDFVVWKDTGITTPNFLAASALLKSLASA